jgi:hypothetical protein
MNMAITPVAARQDPQALDDPATDEQTEEALQSAFASVMLSLAMPMLLRQLQFQKQTITEVFADNQD